MIFLMFLFCFVFLSLPLIRATIYFILQCTVFGPLSAAVELLKLLLWAAPYSCSAAYCCYCCYYHCCCCCHSLLLLLQWAAQLLLRLRAALAAPLQGLPLAAPLLLLQILSRTIQSVAPFCRAQTRDRTIGTSQPTTVLARQDLFNQAQPADRIHPDCPCPPLQCYSPRYRGRHNMAFLFCRSFFIKQNEALISLCFASVSKQFSYQSFIPRIKVDNDCHLSQEMGFALENSVFTCFNIDIIRVHCNKLFMKIKFNVLYC